MGYRIESFLAAAVPVELWVAQVQIQELQGEGVVAATVVVVEVGIELAKVTLIY